MKNETQKKVYKVMIVDDVSDNLQLISNILYDSDIEISVAYDGRKAIDALLLESFDLVLLDISMPELSGYEVCRILKADARTQDIPVIFLTARTDIDSIAKGFEVGGHDYVTKPFNTKELMVRVRTHLELKDKKDQLKQTNEILERKVFERTKQLEQANAKLSKLDKSKNDFLLLINHELRTPLHGIKGLTTLLEESLQATEYAELVESINISADRLVRLAESALLITSIRADGYKTQMHTFDLESFINNFLKEYQFKFQEKKITTTFFGTSPQLRLQTDKNLFHTCLDIIFNNAVRHTPVGKNIEINTFCDEKGINIEIIDGGGGFSPELLTKSFDFFVSENVQNYSFGFGLGLATAKLIMETLSGDIEIKNRGGACVKLRFFNENDNE